MFEATQEVARRVAQIHLHSGKDSYLHREVALRELRRDRAMNNISSHGQVTYQRGQVSLPSRSEISEVEEMVSARGRPICKRVESECL